jgi:hypothetical protein
MIDARNIAATSSVLNDSSNNGLLVTFSVNFVTKNPLAPKTNSPFTMAPVTRSKGNGSSRKKKKPTILKATGKKVSKRFWRRNDKGTPRRLDLGFDLTDENQHQEVRPYELIQNPSAAVIDHPPPPPAFMIGTLRPPPGFDLTDGHQVRPYELIQNHAAPAAGAAPVVVPVFDHPPPPQEPSAIIGTRPLPGFDLTDSYQLHVYELIQNPAPPAAAAAAAVIDLTPNNDAEFRFGFDWTDDQLVRVYDEPIPNNNPAQPPAPAPAPASSIGKVRFHENGTTHPERTDEQQSQRNVKQRMGRIRRQLRKAGVRRTQGIFRDTTNNKNKSSLLFPVLPKTGTDESVCDGWQPPKVAGAARVFSTRSSVVPRIIQKDSDEAVWRGCC